MKVREFSQGPRSERRNKRYLFFEEITRSAYHINESLRKDVYIPFRSVIPRGYTPEFEELEDLIYEHFRKTRGNSKRSDYEHSPTWEAYMMADDNHYPELIPVRNAVIAWSRDNHLDADWCREIAVETLNDWLGRERNKDDEDEEKDVNAWGCYPGGGRYRLHPLVEDKMLPLPGFPPYLPFRHKSTEEYLEEVERWMQRNIISQSIWHQLKSSFIGSFPKVREKLDTYIESDLKRIRKIAGTYIFCVEYFYEQEGYEPVNPQPEEAKFVKWAVQAQIGMESLSDIARSEDLFNGAMPNTAYVSREVKKVLGAINLPPRPGLFERGRPKGVKETSPRNLASKH